MMYTEYAIINTTTMTEGVNPDYDGGDALYKG